MRTRATIILVSIVLIAIVSHTSIVTAEQRPAPGWVEPALAAVNATNTPTRTPTPIATHASQIPPTVMLPRPVSPQPTSQATSSTTASAPTRAATRMPVPTSQPVIQEYLLHLQLPSAQGLGKASAATLLDSFWREARQQQMQISNLLSSLRQKGLVADFRLLPDTHAFTVRANAIALVQISSHRLVTKITDAGSQQTAVARENLRQAIAQVLARAVEPTPPTLADWQWPPRTLLPSPTPTRTPLPTPIPGTSKAKTMDVVRTSECKPAERINLLTASASHRFWETEPQEASITTFGDQVVVAPGPNDEVNVIIQLKDEPVATYNARLFGVRVPLTQQQQNQVQAYADRLKASRQQVVSQAQQMAIPLRVKREYSYVSNGLAASIKMKDMARLAGLPGVKKVYRDEQVHIVLQDSVPLIGAPSVWAMTDSSGHAVTGQGIRVAIIDTGIDYTHPDLGSGFGSAYKVIGGYDFVNNDADPMDDNGHGTHVAGIVAANGTLKGVAPDARLLAYKVLNGQGSGWSSDIIAAIERATNPDGDPTTNDAVDVINMSLGGSGDPDDPMSQAVDTAVSQGVVVAVAAGNSGRNGYQTVGSPGVARKAFTVGATTKSDALADFSSKGPVPGSFAIKPDILAPGVSINSTVPIGGELGSPTRYRTLDGTSMATPHIAGSAALINQLHPNWTPAMIQASLMNTAKDLGLSAFAQGAGREQVNQAATVRALMTPGSLSLGVDNISQSVWTTSTTFQIQNVSTSSIDYSLAVSGSLPAGITTSLEPSSVSLAPGIAATVTFRITVDNTVVPFPTEAPYAYGATIVAQSGSERLSLPFAFFKSPLLQITFDQEPWIVLIHNRNDKSWSYQYPGTSLTALVPSGIYDVIVLYDNPMDTRIVREGVVVNTLASLTINRSDAIYTVHIVPKDKDNHTLADLFAVGQAFFHKASRIETSVSTGGATNLDFHFSPVSNAYTWEWSVNPYSTPEFYAFNGVATNGIAGNLTYQNDPANFKHVTYRHHPDPGYGQLYVRTLISRGYG